MRRLIVGLIAVALVALALVVTLVLIPAEREQAFQRWLWDVDDQIEAATVELGRPWVWTDVGFEPRRGPRDYQSPSSGGRVELSRFADGTTDAQVQAALDATRAVLARVGAQGRWRITVKPPDGRDFEVIWPDE